MSDASPARRAAPYLGALGLALLALVFLFWLFSPSVDPTTPSGADIEARRAKRKGKKVRIVQADAAPPVMPDYLPLEEDPTIPVVTKTCKWLVTEERRNVPQWVMLDNLRDRGQTFVEDDVRCLTAAGVTPAILDFAERYMDQNRIQEIKGTPGIRLDPPREPTE